MKWESTSKITQPDNSTIYKRGDYYQVMMLQTLQLSCMGLSQLFGVNSTQQHTHTHFREELKKEVKELVQGPAQLHSNPMNINLTSILPKPLSLSFSAKVNTPIALTLNKASKLWPGRNLKRRLLVFAPCYSTCSYSNTILWIISSLFFTRKSELWHVPLPVCFKKLDKWIWS